jgi:endonuclease III related protein
MSKKNLRHILLNIYDRLLAHYGPQHWWPAEDPFEVIVGAILTQSTAWSNVEKAIANLKTAGVLTPSELRKIDISDLAKLIYSSGYYNVKASKLKAFSCWFGDNFGDDLTAMSACRPVDLKIRLLAVYGIGEETADSIILYAANLPVFVIDAYSRRIITRTRLLPEKRPYKDFQRLFMDNLPSNVALFNEYHALLVSLAKEVCHKSPICEKCCIRDLCSTFTKK